MDYPKSYVVTSTDLGGGIHTVMKYYYGDRAKPLDAAVYRGNVEFHSPFYAAHNLVSPLVRIKLSHARKGFSAHHSALLKGFMISEADRRFVWAEARIDEENLVLSQPSIAKSAATRYG